jgi:transcriptional regulator with XRE-family HTH domain
MAGHKTLGAQLRELRGSRTLRDLAGLTGLSYGTIAKYERGRLTPSTEAMEKLLDALGVDGPERERLLAMVRRHGPGEVVAGVPSTGRQLAQLIGYERAASRITNVAPLLIPGILQTRDYARAVIGDGPDTDLRVRLRVERAEILTRTESPVELHAIIHEEALTRRVAAPEIICSQLKHLLRMAELPNVTLQVVPDDVVGALPSLAGPFMVIESEGMPPLVHLEHYQAASSLWDAEDVRSYLAAAKEIAQKAMTPARTAEIIAHIAEQETT